MLRAAKLPAVRFLQLSRALDDPSDPDALIDAAFLGTVSTAAVTSALPARIRTPVEIRLVSRQTEDEQVVAAARAQLRGQVEEAAVAGADGHVLPAVDRVGDREARNRRAEVDLPQDLARAVVEGAEAAVDVAAEDEPAAGGGQRHRRGPLLVIPHHLAGLGRDGLHAASWAVMTQVSGPPRGSQLRPEYALPPAVIGPDVWLAGFTV